MVVSLNFVDVFNDRNGYVESVDEVVAVGKIFRSDDLSARGGSDAYYLFAHRLGSLPPPFSLTPSRADTLIDPLVSSLACPAAAAEGCAAQRGHRPPAPNNSSTIPHLEPRSVSVSIREQNEFRALHSMLHNDCARFSKWT